MLHATRMYGVLAALLSVSVIARAQSAEPARLDDCVPETERFLTERQDQIQREANALRALPEVGVYHADDIGGNEWLLIWAPNAGFVAYFIPDAPCPARVTYGAVRWEGRVLTLIPKIPFHPRLKHMFGERMRIIVYRKQRYLVLESRMKAFRKALNWRGDPDLQPPLLAQQQYSDSFWRQDPFRWQ